MALECRSTGSEHMGLVHCIGITILGGEQNAARGNLTVIDGGYRNEASGNYAVVEGALATNTITSNVDSKIYFGPV